MHCTDLRISKHLRTFTARAATVAETPAPASTGHTDTRQERSQHRHALSQGKGSYSGTMIPAQQQPKLQLVNGQDYREHYANSVQMRVSLWDFFLSFGVINQASPDSVTIQNFQGIYVSPQQAKALFNVLQQNLSQYEATFGEIKLEPQSGHGTFLQ